MRENSCRIRDDLGLDTRVTFQRGSLCGDVAIILELRSKGLTSFELGYIAE
jgi:hypothetical protein